MLTQLSLLNKSRCSVLRASVKPSGRHGHTDKTLSKGLRKGPTNVRTAAEHRSRTIFTGAFEKHVVMRIETEEAKKFVKELADLTEKKSKRERA